MYAATDCASALSDVGDARDGVEVEEGVVEEVEEVMVGLFCHWTKWGDVNDIFI